MILVDPLQWRDFSRRPDRDRERWAHLVSTIADPEVELHAFAVSLGLLRDWFQDNPRHSHYDIRPRQHRSALDQGAVLVSTRHLTRRIAIPICGGYYEHGCMRGSTFSASVDPDLPRLYFCSATCLVRSRAFSLSRN